MHVRVLTGMSMGGPFGRLESGLALDDEAEGPTREGGCWILGFFFERAWSLLCSMRLLWASEISDDGWRAWVGSAGVVGFPLAKYGSGVGSWGEAAAATLVAVPMVKSCADFARTEGEVNSKGRVIAKA